MDRIGISFRSPLPADEIRQQVITPLRKGIESASAGFYSNYLLQDRENPAVDTEHLIVFEVHDFKDGLRVLRLAAQQLPMQTDWRFHNLNPSDPAY